MVPWLDVICGYGFEIAQAPGVDSILSDSLSRLFPLERELEWGHSINNSQQFNHTGVT